MLLVSRKNKNDTKKQQSWINDYCLCTNLRQLSFLFSIIIFIITAVLTTCAVLSNTHTQDILELLKNDIKEERERTEEYYGNDHVMSANEAKLHISQDFVLMMKGILFICMLAGWINTAASAILIYGVASQTAIYMLPWLFTSAFTYFLAMMTEMLIYFRVISGIAISYKVLIVSLSISPIFIQMWYTLLCYYSALRCTCSSRYASSTPITINAYGGYKHTIRPFESEKKPMI